MDNYDLNSNYNPIVQMSNSGEEVSMGDSWETLIFYLKGEKLGLQVDNCWLTRQETETEIDAEAVNDLNKIDNYITVNEDSSAIIRECWNIKVEEGTEVYKQMNNMKGSSIHSLTVAEGETTFEALPDWDVDASREDKKYKSGIIQNGDNYELCFGVGDYGDHTFVMQYTIDNFVFRYADMYGMNSRLVNEDMNVKPDEVYVRVDSPLFTSDTKVYAFGFEGEIYVQQDNDSYYIEAKSKGNVNYVNVLSGFVGAEFTGGNTTYSSRSFKISLMRPPKIAIIDITNGFDVNAIILWEKTVIQFARLQGIAISTLSNSPK